MPHWGWRPQTKISLIRHKLARGDELWQKIAPRPVPLRSRCKAGICLSADTAQPQDSWNQHLKALPISWGASFAEGTTKGEKKTIWLGLVILLGWPTTLHMGKAATGHIGVKTESVHAACKFDYATLYPVRLGLSALPDVHQKRASSSIGRSCLFVLTSCSPVPPPPLPPPVLLPICLYGWREGERETPANLQFPQD